MTETKGIPRETLVEYWEALPALYERRKQLIQEWDDVKTQALIIVDDPNETRHRALAHKLAKENNPELADALDSLDLELEMISARLTVALAYANVVNADSYSWIGQASAR